MSGSLKKEIFCIFTLFIFSSPVFAKNAGVVTMLKGPVEVFVDPSDVAKNSSKQVKFEDKFYTIKAAKIGMKLKFEDVLKTGTQSKVKVNFMNGDAMMVGPGTAYSLDLHKGTLGNEKKKEGQVLNLIYGKVRAVISKTGPRNDLKVKTRSAVAGVRGTDFYIAYNPTQSITRVDVLRGKVAVSEMSNVESKMVQRGFSLTVTTAEVKTKESKVTLRPITKDKLNEIQTETIVETDQKLLKNQNKSIKKMVQDLEIKSKTMILEDIKQAEPEKYKNLMAKGALDADAINASVVADLKERAPSSADMGKVSEEDLRNSLKNQDDAYNKYFK